METKEVKLLLQQYFNGESTIEEEKALEKYFSSGNVASELNEYAEFFGGISELANTPWATGFEEDIMDFILEQEYTEKNRYRGLWKMVTGIAASVILILGSLLIYEQQQSAFKDTYTDPDEAYVQAEKTLQYISSKYNSGLSHLSKTRKYNEALAELRKVDIINKASEPFEKSVKAIQKGFNETKKIEKYNRIIKNE